MSNSDPRTSLYQTLHRQHAQDDGRRRYSAERVLRLVFERVSPRSVLDVGCGRGLWLSVAKQLATGVETLGVEGPWIKDEDIQEGAGEIVVRDLESGFDLSRSFDLVMSIEVAEHLSAASADRFVESLVRHGEFILFSAAIPHQPGTGHVNCQFPDYWAAKFAVHGYMPVDFVRRSIWTDRNVHVWIRQNVLAFASARFAAAAPWVRDLADGAFPLSIVHPEMFMGLVRR